MAEHGHSTQMQFWAAGDQRGAASATFSPCGAYRYDLRRTWDPRRKPVIFIGLNPSTADAFRDDATIRREVRFAERWGCGGLIKLNLFGLRSTDPRALRQGEDPVGPDNDATIERVLTSFPEARLVLCWGTEGTLMGRGRQVLAVALALHRRPEHFGLTQNGQPKHPLYLSQTTPLIPWGCA